MHRMGTLLPVVLVLAMLGCTQQLNVEAERTAVRSVDAQMVSAANAGELERWSGFLAEDAMLMPPNEPPVAGKAAIRQLVNQMAASGKLHVVHGPLTVEVSRSGDLAYIFYNYELTMNDPAGKPVTDKGKDVSVYRKQADGSWRLLVDIWNSGPAPAAR